MNAFAEVNRRAVWTKTLCVTGGYLLAIWLVYLKLVSLRYASGGLYLVTAFVVVQCGAIALLLAGSFSAKRVNLLRERLARRINPQLREELANYAAGGERLSTLRNLNQMYPRDFELSLIEFLSTLTGEPHAILSRLAADLGLVARWEKQYRHGRARARRKVISHLGLLAGWAGGATLVSALDDKHEGIRIDAGRALLRSTGDDGAERVFLFARHGSLLIRAISAEDLRPRALALCERVIPESLTSSDPRIVMVTLEFLEAWQTSLPLPKLPLLFSHPNPEIRAKALRVLPNNTHATEVDRDVLAAFEDQNEGVKAAAAFAAGRLRMESALAHLTAGLRHPDWRFAKASASALGDLGPAGWNVLENEVLYGAHPAAALEALERVGVNR